MWRSEEFLSLLYRSTETPVVAGSKRKTLTDEEKKEVANDMSKRFEADKTREDVERALEELTLKTTHDTLDESTNQSKKTDDSKKSLAEDMESLSLSSEVSSNTSN